MRALFVWSSVLLLVTPLFADASVRISEVAWMGSIDDANAEWIELYNSGDSQDVTGWTLTAKDGQPSITLSGNIGSGVYALLERSDDTTVSGVTAFSVYTGALGNTGEVLELRDANGVLQDSVDGTGDWSIGGDNTTKETLQRSGVPSVGSWTTASPNPQGGAVGSGEGEETTTVRVSGASILRPASSEEEEKTHLAPTLTLDLGGEQTVTVGVPSTFLARAYRGSGEEIVVSDIDWNFGDGTTKKGREVEHVFLYTGEYVVSATGNRSGFLREVQDTERIVVHVVEPSVAIVHADSAYIEVKNKSKNELDISGFVLVGGSTHFRIPEATHLLPDTSVRFPKKTTGVDGGLGVSLFHPDGSLASVYGEVATAPAPIKLYVPVTAQTKVEKDVEVKTETPSLFDTLHESSALPELAKTANAYEGVGAETGAGEKTPLWWWLFALVLVIGTTVVAVVLLRKEQAEVIEGFYIEED